MRVLIAHDYGALVGGAEGQIALHAEGLRARGIEVHLLASSAPVTGETLPVDVRCAGTTGRLRGVLQAANPSAARAMRRALADFRPDVVHVAMFLTQLSPLVLRPLARVPAVYHAMWYRAVCPRGTKLLPDRTPCRSPAGFACLRNGCVSPLDAAPLALQARLLRRWRGYFDLVVANGPTVATRLAEAGWSPVEVMGHGVPGNAERPPLPELPVVAYAGRLVPEKGVDVLIRAFARLGARVPAARLLIAGTGTEEPALRALAQRLGVADRVEFLGHLGPADLEARFAAAWVQAVPSVWEEPFGVVAAEAMMRGTAVVASRVGGLSGIVVEGQTGRLVDPGDSQALASALESLLVDRAAAERMGRLGRAAALESFALAPIIDWWIDTYERLIEAAANGHR